MLKFKNYIIKYQEFLIGLLIISLPFLEFIKVNYYSLDKLIYKNILLFFLSASIIFIIFFLFLKIISAQNESILKYVLTFTIFFWLLFQFESIQNFFFKIGINELNKDNLSAEISLLIIFFFSLLFLKKNFTKFIYKFLIFFFVIQHFFVYVILIKNYTLDNFNKKNYSNLKKIKKIEYFSGDEIKFINQNKKYNKNIYYLIMDGMTSLEEYKNLGGKDNTQELIKKFKKFGYNYIPNTYSTHGATSKTLGAILNLNPIIEENTNISDQLYLDLIFPNALQKSMFDIKQYPQLIMNLKKINYSFKWFGNYKHNCNDYNKYLCIEYTEKKSTKNNFFNQNINFYVLKFFLANTPIEELYRIYHQKFIFKKTNINEAKKILKDDIIGEFIYKIKKFHKNNSLYFYFIHDLSLKSPIYSYNSNCEQTGYKNTTNSSENLNISKYLEHYDCMIKKIDKFIMFLESHDPNAIVIIQSDHGFKDPYKNIKSLERYAIINLVKVGEKCVNEISNKIDSVNSVRLAISCATQTSPKLIEKKIIYSNRRDKNKDKLIEIEIKY